MKRISVAIPEELIKELQEYRKKTGIGQSELIRALLRDVLTPNWKREEVASAS